MIIFFYYKEQIYQLVVRHALAMTQRPREDLGVMIIYLILSMESELTNRPQMAPNSNIGVGDVNVFRQLCS